MKWRKYIKSTLITIFSMVEAISCGLYVNQVSANVTDEITIFKAMKMTGMQPTIIIAIVLLAPHIFLFFVPDSAFNKKEVINNLLKSLTEATFHTYKGLDISAVVQVCNKRKKKRIVKYNYNTDDNLKLNETIDINFGDIGAQCIDKKGFLFKECTFEEWCAAEEKYRDIVPKELRLIIGEPILDDKRNVIAVLEVDIFESTTESAEEGSKPGYLTDNITVHKVMKELNDKRNIKKILGTWAASVKVLLENF